MEENLKYLLNKLEMEEKYFLDGMIEKINHYTKDDHYEFIIKLKNILPLETYKTIKEKIKYAYTGYENTTVKFKVENQNVDNIKDYFNYALNKIIKSESVKNAYLDCDIDYSDHTIKLIVSNKAESLRIEKEEKKLKDILKVMGFSKLKVNITIDNSKKSCIIEEPIIIKKEPKEKKSKIILGSDIKKSPEKISELVVEENDVVVYAKIFDMDFFESPRGPFKIITLKITDETDSIYAKYFTRDANEYLKISKQLKKDSWYLIRGYSKNDQYAKELVLNIRDLIEVPKKEEELVDTAEEKRVELHAHTFMSQMDGVISPKELVKYAKKLGHKAVAVTDHNGVQSFPDIYNEIKYANMGKPDEEKFKVLFGVELAVVDDEAGLITRPTDDELKTSTYIVFDTETTGFNAGGYDQMIEIGAVKVKENQIIDRFSMLIDPKRELPKKIIEITSITDEMLKGQKSEEEVTKLFLDWIGDLPLVAHNAKFDMSFLESAISKYNLRKLKNPVLDTLELSRALDPEQRRHSLSALVKRYEVPFDENAHHRADYDAEGTAYIFMKMIDRISDFGNKTLKDINNLIKSDDLFKFGKVYHVNAIAKTREGLKNIFKLVSYANTKYLYRTPRIVRSELEKLRKDVLLSSGCYMGEVFDSARTKTEEELVNIIKFYDYIEVQPLEVYSHLVKSGSFKSMDELKDIVMKIIDTAKRAGVMVCASGDVHHLRREDKVYREVIINQKVPGGGLHPLYNRNMSIVGSQHFRTTDEMLSDFDFLDEKYRKEIVITNPNKVADMVEHFEVIIDTKGIPFSPKIKDSDKEVREMVYGKARSIYGENLPALIEERIESELKGIIGGGFDVIYLISQKLVKKSNEDGYIVGSRGSVGSSFVATMMGITEVNPLPPHYVCPECKNSIFEENGKSLGEKYPSGYDLPEKECPTCGTNLTREGNDMPFATFLGFNADKVPDIDLNFSGVYQWRAHEYTKELFGIDNVYRAGTIGTVADKTAYGFVKGFFEDRGETRRSAEIERLAKGCTGVKRTTGQHPGGIIVVPDYKEIFDFTPYQYPADDSNSLWRTSHFDYHAIDENLLKLDILGHDDPTVLKMLTDLTGKSIFEIPFTDPKVMQLFTAPDVLGVSAKDILCETGTLGVPEFGTKFVIGMLKETKPKTFGELLKISGLSHGTDVWVGNARDLIAENLCEFKDVIGCRDDIMVYLMYNGVAPKDAFKIMEFVRKGKASKIPDEWAGYVKIMEEANIPEWYIDSCFKIKYMFPKAHATAYVMSALRIAWFKVHMPIYYYAAYFSVRCTDFDAAKMIEGYDSIKDLVVEYTNKGYDLTNKESSTLEVMQLVLEASARGIKFANIDVLKSDASDFVVLDDNTLLPPFRIIDGLGDQVAKRIVEEREKQPFLSIEDLQKRGKVNSTTIEKMRFMGMLDGMDESSQLSLF